MPSGRRGEAGERGGREGGRWWVVWRGEECKRQENKWEIKRTDDWIKENHWDIGTHVQQIIPTSGREIHCLAQHAAHPLIPDVSAAFSLTRGYITSLGGVSFRFTLYTDTHQVRTTPLPLLARSRIILVLGIVPRDLSDYFLVSLDLAYLLVIDCFVIL